MLIEAELALQRLEVKLLRNFGLVQPERELGLDQDRGVVVTLLSGREVVLADVELRPISRSSWSEGMRSPASIREM